LPARLITQLYALPHEKYVLERTKTRKAGAPEGIPPLRYLEDRGYRQKERGREYRYEQEKLTEFPAPEAKQRFYSYPCR